MRGKIIIARLVLAVYKLGAVASWIVILGLIEPVVDGKLAPVLGIPAMVGFVILAKYLTDEAYYGEWRIRRAEWMRRRRIRSEA
jgi:hypothetical protein